MEICEIDEYQLSLQCFPQETTKTLSAGWHTVPSGKYKQKKKD